MCITKSNDPEIQALIDAINAQTEAIYALEIEALLAEIEADFQ